MKVKISILRVERERWRVGGPGVRHQRRRRHQSSVGMVVLLFVPMYICGVHLVLPLLPVSLAFGTHQPFQRPVRQIGPYVTDRRLFADVALWLPARQEPHIRPKVALHLSNLIRNGHVTPVAIPRRHGTEAGVVPGSSIECREERSGHREEELVHALQVGLASGVGRFRLAPREEAEAPEVRLLPV